MWKTPPFPPLFLYSYLENVSQIKLFFWEFCNVQIPLTVWQILVLFPLLAKDWHVLVCEPLHSLCTKRAGLFLICSYPKMPPQVFEQALVAVCEGRFPRAGHSSQLPVKQCHQCHWLHREHTDTSAVSFLRMFPWGFCQLLSISVLYWDVVVILTFHLRLCWHHSSAWASLTLPGAWHSLPLLSFTHWNKEIVLCSSFM